MRHLVLVFALIAGAHAAAVAQTASPVSAGISVDGAWARATTGKMGGVFMTVIDRGAEDRVTGASTPIADAAELHQTLSEGGVMKMRPVEGGLLVTPGKPVALAPGGYHLMLMGLKRPLKEGDSFPLTLTFEHAPSVTVQVAVKKAGAMAASGSMPEGMKMSQ